MNRDDNVFLSEGGIVVSQARIVNQAGTIAVNAVAFCLAREERHKGMFWLRIGAILVSLTVGMGLGGAISGEAIGFVIGLAIAIAGVAASIHFIKAKRYVIVLGTSSGEVPAVVSQDREFILRVEQAINQALEARG